MNGRSTKVEKKVERHTNQGLDLLQPYAAVKNGKIKRVSHTISLDDTNFKVFQKNLRRLRFIPSGVVDEWIAKVLEKWSEK
jgi:hypothetical protein